MGSGAQGTATLMEAPRGHGRRPSRNMAGGLTAQGRHRLPPYVIPLAGPRPATERAFGRVTLDWRRVVGRLWRNYGLSITLVALFLGSWALQTWMGWIEFVAEQESHGQAADAFGAAGYFWRWGQSTFENWQSEFLQIFVFIVLTTFLIHRKSHESPDTDYDTEASLRRIEAKLDALENAK